MQSLCPRGCRQRVGKVDMQSANAWRLSETDCSSPHGLAHSPMASGQRVARRSNETAIEIATRRVRSHTAPTPHRHTLSAFARTPTMSPRRIAGIHIRASSGRCRAVPSEEPKANPVRCAVADWTATLRINASRSLCGRRAGGHGETRAALRVRLARRAHERARPPNDQARDHCVDQRPARIHGVRRPA